MVFNKIFWRILFSFILVIIPFCLVLSWSMHHVYGCSNCRLFNSRSGCRYTVHLLCCIVPLSSLELNNSPEQLLGGLEDMEDIMLSVIADFVQPSSLWIRKPLPLRAEAASGCQEGHGLLRPTTHSSRCRCYKAFTVLIYDCLY
jgi:hypothetical protein